MIRANFDFLGLEISSACPSKSKELRVSHAVTQTTAAEEVYAVLPAHTPRISLNIIANLEVVTGIAAEAAAGVHRIVLHIQVIIIIIGSLAA